MIRKIFTFFFAVSLFLAVAIPLLVFHSPASHSNSSYTEKETDFFLNHYAPSFFGRTTKNNNNDNEKMNTNVSVMSFNVRLDAQEENPDNHFTKRVFRLSDTIQKWQPTIIGMQEPFGGQVEHLLSIVNLKTEQEVEERKRRDGICLLQEQNLHRNDTIATIVGERRRVIYKALGYNRAGIDRENRVHPARHMDFRAGILYRPDQLELLEQGYIRLTTTPDAEREEVLRVGNIARFRVLDDNENGNEKSKEILHFNTHLCVKSEKGRRTQSALLIDEIAKWKRKYPDAIVFVTGDFNSAPGQAAHRTLLGSASDEEIFAKSSVNSKSFLSSSQEERSQLLADTYETCSTIIASPSSSPSSSSETEKKNCVFGNDLALSFNGWLPATFVDSYLARWGFGRLAFTLHAMQFKLPLSPPWTQRAIARGVLDFVSSAPEYFFSESLPKSFTRLHVDWILHDQKLAKPKMFHVADARDEKLSSDHFPVVAVFEI